MIAIDTNILVYAHREDAEWHDAATRAIEKASVKPWAIAWPCLHEFLAIVSHPRIFDPPSPMDDALLAVVRWTGSSMVTLLAEAEGYTEILSSLLSASRVVGPRVHDARIAALCVQHGIDELWTADRDFARFSSLTTRNPLVSS